MAGVMEGFTMCILTDALQLNNHGESFMTKTVYYNVVYYRSTIAHMNDKSKSMPMQQRFRGKTTGRGRRVNLNEAKDFFMHNVNHHFKI